MTLMARGTMMQKRKMRNMKPEYFDRVNINITAIREIFRVDIQGLHRVIINYIILQWFHHYRQPQGHQQADNEDHRHPCM